MIPILSDCAKAAGFELAAPQLEQFRQYADLLVEWNKKMNLTAITEPGEIITKHFIDSLYGLPYLPNGGTLIDVGTGAGFPGIPLKIARPDLSLTLLDSLNKRLTFLNEVIRELALPDVKTVHTRAEEGAVKKSPLREKFDVATSRAVAQLNALAEYCLPYVKVGGVFLAYKGGDVEEECKNAKNAVKTLGGDIRDIVSYTIPTTDITHTLVVIEKIKETADIYPRQQGKISKKPL
ncbi:MAG: 16S rRNA (guanine(527)-N(7))-methyltransferase RsmG [Clostridia bacterium]|nr:16S rRNA (guanine(527)-N(7))-methyltransferase RsmG [Clostridia bacterium]